ncbi:MAG: PAS domain S-box protein, partial [Deltaproteobacteria bacterium]|nr:PAS domain S-box protein [Deltaproteobacteria bacterium]
MFDYKVMSRFGIPLSALPEHSTVINKPVSFYAAHRVVIQTALGIIVFLAVVISLLTINIIQRRRSVIALRASEAKYYDLYENAPDMHFSVDVKTATITECNNTFVEAFGYSKEEILGLSIFEIHHPDGREEAKRVFQQFAATGEVHDAERMIRRKDGEIIYVSLNASAVRDKEGKITHSRSVWRDITERKQVEEALKEREEKYWDLFNNAEVGIFRSRLDGSELMEINRRFLDIVGMTREETLGKPSVNLWADPKEREEMVKRLVADGSVSAFEYKMLNKRQGDVRNCLTSLRLDREQGILEGSILDITDRRQAEEALRRSEENFHRSLDDSPLGVRIVTIEGETVYANRTMLNIFGYDSIEELRTTPLKERYTPESYAEFQIRKEKRKRRGDGPSEYDISIVRKDGEVRHLHVFRKDILWNGEEQFQVIYQD